MTDDEFLEGDLNGDDIKTRNDLETLHQAYLWFLITVNNSENHTTGVTRLGRYVI